LHLTAAVGERQQHFVFLVTSMKPIDAQPKPRRIRLISSRAFWPVLALA
jgi:hypothetical protein